MTVNFRGYVFDDSGAAVSGADISLFPTGTTNSATATTTTDSNGLWYFATAAENRYDIQIEKGSSKRRIRWDDQIQLKEIDVRNNTGNTTPALTAKNLTNNPANQVALFGGANSTRADGDLIYLSFELANAAGEDTEFARMIVEAEDAHDGSEDGAIRFQVMRDGTLATVWEVKATGDGDINAPTMSFDLNMDSLSIGNGADTDIVLTFDANSNDGVITWMEDEDYFQFSDDILMSTTERINLRDDAIYIYSSADGQLDLVADTEIQIAATTVDINGAVDISGDLTIRGADGALNFINAGENSIKIPDNQASALIIEEADNAYITFVTTDSSEAITVAKATTFSAGIADAGTIAAGTWNGTDIGVAYGGTGASSLTDGGVLLGSGTGAITAMAVLADGEMIVGDGSGDPVAESGADLRTSIGVGTGDSPQFTGIELGHATDTTITRASSGVIAVEGTNVLLAGAQTGITTILNASTKIGRDSDNLVDFATTDNKIIFRVEGVNEVELVQNALSPVTSDGVALGTGSLMWSDLFLASGSVINLNNGDITLTHSSETLTVGGGTLATGALTTSTIVASGIVKTNDTTNATSTTDGSLQTDGGLSVVLDAIFGDDVTLITDAAVLSLGAGSDVTITHDDSTGGTISGTPMVYESLGAAELADDKHAGIVLEFLAAESIAVGQLVYMSTTDGRVGLADADATGKYPAIGVAVSAQGSAGSAVKILTHGTFNDSDGFGGDLTEGNKLYLSETAGGFTATAPSDDGDIVQVVGIAIGPRDVFINPSLDVIEHA